MTEQKTTYWLNNAHSYLKKFQRQRLYEHNISRDTMNEKQKTFDQCEIPSSKDSPEKFHKLKIKQEIQNDYKMKKKNIESDYIITSIAENPQTKDQTNEQIKDNSNQNNKIALSDMIVKQHLTKTLKIYQQDLTQLQQNRDNLIQVIQEISIKIQSLNDLQSKNQILQLQNFKNKREILTLMKQYHDLKLNTERKKIKINQNFMKKKQRIKTLMQIYPQQTQFVVQSQSFDHYQYQLKVNKQISSPNPPQKQVIEQIFPKLQQQPQKPKLKDKQKSKVIDKASLLGDLKSFAKNFKMPNNSVNQI